MRLRLKRVIPRSLFGRSLLIIVTPLVVLQCVVAFVFFKVHVNKITERLAEGVTGELLAVIRLVEAAPDEDAVVRALSLGRTSLDIDARLVADGAMPEDLPWPATSVGRKLAAEIVERVKRPALVDDRRSREAIHILIPTDRGVLDMTVRNERMFSRTAYVTLLWMMGASFVLILVAVHFLRKQVRPIRLLAEAAESFGKGRTDVEMRPEGAREVKRAATAFLAMRERIQRQVSQRTQMLAGVSHDLRTPLTRIKLQLALLPGNPETEALKSDVRDMERMVEAYLAFARGEEGEAPEPTDLARVIEQACERARAGGSVIACRCEGDLNVEVRAGAIARSIANLVENAARYGQRVEVGARRWSHRIEITVDDDGPGIPAAEREAVFRAFHRLEDSRNPETGGVGLGLTIARDAVRRHGGDVALAESPLGGLRAQITLPV
jgi:two-component system, OmpR family, osmolarity sensor histidine kinase EnvZ